MTEWKTYRLGELVKVKGGKRLPKGISLQTTPNTHPYIRIRDMGKNRVLELDATYEYVDDVTQKSIARYVVDEGDILLSIVGTIGLVGIVGKSLHQANQTENCVKLVSLNGIDPLFLYYFLLSPKGQEEIKRGTVGAVQAKLPIKNIENIEISLPSLEEQRRIAGILGAIDDKIEINRRINTNLELQAQALFEEIFFSDNDWEYTTLGMLTEEVKTKVKGRDAKVLSPISSGELVLSEDYFTKQVYSQDTSKYIVVEPKTFAYNPARINIGSIGINSFDFVGCVSPVYVVFKTKCEYENFFRLFVKSDIFKEEVKSRAIGGVRQTLSYRDFAMITTKHPPIESIRIFNDQYNTLLDIINHNNTENRVLASLRDTLLPKLMNGEIKL